MRLTTKGRYAVTAMLDLAIHHGGGPITLADIAQRQGISLSYLEQLFARLRKRNLVSSVRGRVVDTPWSRGVGNLRRPGYRRGRRNVDTTRVAGRTIARDNQQCLTHDLWRDLSNRIYEYLNQISLQDLMNRSGVQEVAERQENGDGRASEPGSAEGGIGWRLIPGRPGI